MIMKKQSRILNPIKKFHIIRKRNMMRYYGDDFSYLFIFRVKRLIKKHRKTIKDNTYHRHCIYGGVNSVGCFQTIEYKMFIMYYTKQASKRKMDKEVHDLTKSWLDRNKRVLCHKCLYSHKNDKNIVPSIIKYGS